VYPSSAAASFIVIVTGNDNRIADLESFVKTILFAFVQLRPLYRVYIFETKFTTPQGLFATKSRGRVHMMERARLRRSRHNRMVGGVCGGLSEFFGISSFWFRLLFLILLVPGGLPGFLPYLILWIVIPSA
jgi:phage shock protein C